eukprot:XP_017447797.1 PREDICTED: ankyrin repeat domain-containing protein 60 isoform X4 [Rattus norvegicus]
MMQLQPCCLHIVGEESSQPSLHVRSRLCCLLSDPFGFAQVQVFSAALKAEQLDSAGEPGSKQTQGLKEEPVSDPSPASDSHILSSASSSQNALSVHGQDITERIWILPLVKPGPHGARRDWTPSCNPAEPPAEPVAVWNQKRDRNRLCLKRVNLKCSCFMRTGGESTSPAAGLGGD